MLTTFLSNKVAEIVIGLLLSVVIWLSYSLWESTNEVETLENDKVELTRELAVSKSSLALSTANEILLKLSIESQNMQINSLKVDLDKASKQYKIQEKKVYEIINTERVVLKDLNESEDCIQTKRIVNEIINLR